MWTTARGGRQCPTMQYGQCVMPASTRTGQVFHRYAHLHWTQRSSAMNWNMSCVHSSHSIAEFVLALIWHIKRRTHWFGGHCPGPGVVGRPFGFPLYARHAYLVEINQNLYFLSSLIPYHKMFLGMPLTSAVVVLSTSILDPLSTIFTLCWACCMIDVKFQLTFMSNSCFPSSILNWSCYCSKLSDYSEWLGAGMVIRLGQGPDLPLTISCFSKSRLVLPFWYRLIQGVPDKGPLNGCQLLFSVPCMLAVVQGLMHISVLM